MAWYRASLQSLVLEESWTSCLKHGVSHEPFSLLIIFGKNNGSVGLVSFQFRLISAFEVWTFGLAEMFIPFGHSFWAILLGIWAFEQMLIVWVVGFGRRRSHAKARATIGVGQEIVVQSQADYFAVQLLDLYRVEYADLEGQRFVSCFFGSIKRCASSPKAPSH